MPHAQTLLVIFLLLAPGALHAASLDEMAAGVGQGEGARLSMLFEVSFLSIDVADVEALLGPEDAAKVAAIARDSKLDKETRAKIADVLLNADPCLVSMRFRRDASWDRFLSGTRGNLESAVKAEIITPEEFDKIWPQLVDEFKSMEERGVKKGDGVYYRVDGDQVRTAYYDAQDSVLVEYAHEGNTRARATRGAYFGPKSRFSKKLIESLERE